VITLKLGKWPPSTNKLFTVARNRKILSAEGRAYHNYIRFIVAQAMPPPVRRDIAYAFQMQLYRKDWTNKNWPKTKEKFKRFDLSNRIKCVEDGIVAALDMDDSQFFHMEHEKIYGDPKIIIRIYSWVPSTNTTEPS